MKSPIYAVFHASCRIIDCTNSTMLLGSILNRSKENTTGKLITWGCVLNKMGRISSIVPQGHLVELQIANSIFLSARPQ